MKLLYSWLNDFVDLSDTDVNTVADRLTMGAFEVEGIDELGAKLEGKVVLGEIKDIVKHPDADKLRVTQTCIGKDADGKEIIEQIVCGAANIAPGQKIPVATVGSKVINRHDGSVLEIKKAKIRGVESSGMLCSPDELGYDEETAKKLAEAQGSDGIYILFDPNNMNVKDQSKGFEIGEDLRKVLGLEKDYVLDVGARSNRGDALSVLGQAREIAALLSKQVQERNLSDLSVLEKTVKINKSIKTIEPAIADEADCAVFHTIALENLKVYDSPNWLKQRVEAMGTRSINSLVDVSNYVLYELGQPTHFYDRDKLKTDTLLVRRAKDGEEIKTLDDLDYKLNERNLIIADGSAPVAIAGVMGGFDSQITDTSTSVIIESAAFTAASVRKSARAAGIESEAKKRFERGVDNSRSMHAVIRCVQLLAQIAAEHGDEITISEIHTAGTSAAKEQKVSIKLESIKRYLGVDIEKDTIIKLLEPLEIKISQDNNDSLEFLIPSFRQADIYREVDLIEEIGRLYGFDNIAAASPSTSVSTAPMTEREQNLANVTKVMLAHGFSQATLSSLIGDTLSSEEKKFAAAFDFNKEIRMQNPLSREHATLRQLLVPGLVQAASRNYAYDRSKDIKLFEIGKTYFKETSKKDTLGKTTPSSEHEKLAAIMIADGSNWQESKKGHDDFYKLKGIVEDLFPRAVLIHASEVDAKAHPFISFSHPGISALIQQDKRDVGFICKLHPSVCKEWDLPEHAFVLEVNLPKSKKIKFKTVANTPVIDRDITVDLKSDISSDQVTSLIKKSCSKDLINIDLVSVYQSNEESKSLSFRLKWQSDSETLSGEAIDKEVQSVKDKLEKDLGAKFRA